MAYAALVSISQLLEQILHHDQLFYIPPSEEQKLKSLHEKICFLQGFLDDYSHKGESLEAQVRDAAYQAQDIIEYHFSDQIRSGNDNCGVKRGFLQLVSTTGKVEQRKIQNKYEEDLVKALMQIDSVVQEATNIQISCRVEEIQTSQTPALAPIGRNKMVGFDEDLIAIKERLCGESSKLGIIPIVGMGGIGKTTLARNIFDDSLVAYRFDIHAWVTISQECNFRKVLLSLLDSLPATTMDLSNTNEQLMENAYKSLKGRRYLIIMDDMWSPEVWDDLRKIFPDDNNGSQIMITTRLTNVAEYASCGPIHHMQFLNEDQSWNLLREKVFVEQSYPPELAEIGRIIAKSCCGLPLAIVVVAGILVKVDRSQHHWRNIAENISLAMATTDDDFSKILTLSYDHLPNHLKACFLYMGGFPEDYEIPVSKLIMLWVAEGFLKPFGSKSLEEVAEEYLEDLVSRNLVLISWKTSNGKFRFCGMHDLLRDLCLWKAQEEKFLDVYSSRIDIANQRRLAIHSPGGANHHLIENTYVLPIRSVLHFGNSGLFSFVLRSRLLRVLDMVKPRLDYFPVEITELFHLRYLAFTYYHSRGKPLILPPEISKLHNLQTLIIHLSLYMSPRIQFQIWKFPQLRHLILKTMKDSKLKIPLASRIGWHFPVLENLQTLTGVVNFKLTRKALHMIPKLKKLKILCTANCSKLRLNNLIHLQQLEKLSLEFDFWPQVYPSILCYALPPTLKKLTLTRCRPPSNDMSIIGSLPNLEVLKLDSFTFVEGCWESNEGEFPKLKFLLIQLSNLVCWQAESSHFPCLKHLIIRHCSDLTIPQAIGDITSLELIEVGPLSMSAAASAVLILEEQRGLGNETLQLRLLH